MKAFVLPMISSLVLLAVLNFSLVLDQYLLGIKSDFIQFKSAPVSNSAIASK